MFDEMLTERQRAKLHADEFAVWAGRPKPTFWGEGNLFNVFFGAVWSTFVGFFVSQVGVTVWRDFAAEPSWAKFGAAIGITAFITPFVCVGIGTLFSPLWRYIGMSMTRWAVTNKRLLRFAPFKLTYWDADELTEDVETNFLDSLYPRDFPFAQTALKRLDDSIEDEDEYDEEEEDDEEAEETGQSSAVPDGAPKRVKVEVSPDGGLVIEWNHFSWYFIPAFVAAAFMCFFCIGRTYGEQLLRLARDGKLELHMMIFGIPFLAITIFSVAEALWFLLGRTKLTRTGNSLTVYRGILGLGLRKRLTIPTGAKFVISQSGTINKMPLYKLAMNSGQGITALMKSTRYDVLEYIASVLNR